MTGTPPGSEDMLGPEAQRGLSGSCSGVRQAALGRRQRPGSAPGPGAGAAGAGAAAAILPPSPSPQPPLPPSRRGALSAAARSPPLSPPPSLRGGALGLARTRLRACRAFGARGGP